MSIHKLSFAAVLCLAVLGFAAAQATAAGYHAYLCKVPYGPNAGRPAPTEGTSYTQNSATTLATDSCASGGAMSAVVDGTSHQAGEGSAVVYTAPAGMTIAGFRVWRHEAVGPVAGAAGPFTKFEYGSSLLEPACQRNLGCAERGDGSSPFAARNDVAVGNLGGVTQLRWNAFCGGAGTCPVSEAGARSAVYDVFAADVLLVDSAPVAVTDVSGPLLAGGTLVGAQSVSFLATDTGSGVHKGSLVVDGVVVSESVLDDAGGACADLGVSPDGLPSYLNTRPCPASVNGLLTLNTDLLSPGAHDLTIRVADAAGNRTVVRNATISVVGPRPAGTPNGSGASRLAKLTARFAGRGPRRARRLRFRAAPTISGRLVDERDDPIAAAAVDVLVRDRRAGAQRRRIATATTGADGRFRVQLPSGPARTITVQYTAFSGDAKPSTTATLSARVRGRISAVLAPRVVRVGGRIRISGRLGYVRRSGVTVIVQVRNRQVRQPFGVRKTDSDGRYRWTYRFTTRGSAGKTFAFRVKVDSPLYPFTTAYSRWVYVSVR